ncbi:primosomal protein N' (replication factor Y) (superfamily II helicase) [Parelusimicrobium proximum]|uniref:endonuclease domain-containing protein n=1 Tax=Parelusimicrobium proximum TaxID=3228953 RepID=UPI003D16F2CC
MDQRLKKFARQNRTSPTPQEHKIWNLLKNKLMGYKFRRQHPVGEYIVDFICVDKNLIIECDGGQHNDAADKNRDEYMKARGYKVLRIWNKDIDRDIEGVYIAIMNALK